MAYKDKKMAAKKANEYSKEHYDRITVMAKKGSKEKFKKAAEFKGMNLSAFIEACVEKEISRMKEI